MWVKRERSHECREPILWPWIRAGSVWECDDCGERWVVRVDRRGARFSSLVRTSRVPEMPLSNDPRRPPKGPGSGAHSKERL